MTTHEQELEQLRGLVFSAAYKLRTIRLLALARTADVSEGLLAISPAVAAELDAILAELAEHESGRPLESAEQQIRSAAIGATGDSAESFMRQIREANIIL